MLSSWLDLSLRLYRKQAPHAPASGPASDLLRWLVLPLLSLHGWVAGPDTDECSLRRQRNRVCSWNPRAVHKA